MNCYRYKVSEFIPLRRPLLEHSCTFTLFWLYSKLLSNILAPAEASQWGKIPILIHSCSNNMFIHECQSFVQSPACINFVHYMSHDTLFKFLSIILYVCMHNTPLKGFSSLCFLIILKPLCFRIYVVIFKPKQCIFWWPCFSTAWLHSLKLHSIGKEWWLTTKTQKNRRISRYFDSDQKSYDNLLNSHTIL